MKLQNDRIQNLNNGKQRCGTLGLRKKILQWMAYLYNILIKGWIEIHWQDDYRTWILKTSCKSDLGLFHRFAYAAGHKFRATIDLNADLHNAEGYGAKK